MSNQSKRHTYESLYLIISELEPSSLEGTRKLEWIDENHILGICKDFKNCIEIFISGSKLSCSSRNVASHLEYDSWRDITGNTFSANRLKFPPEKHFDAVIAFVALNLLENIAKKDIQNGFTDTEPVIDMALDPVKFTNEDLIGLIGELWIMNKFIELLPDSCEEIVYSWKGWDRSLRDWSFPWMGIEVKTTGGTVSRHSVSNVKQLELGFGDDQFAEASLYLISVGLESDHSEKDNENNFSIPILVEEIINKINVKENNIELVNYFIDKVSLYGIANSGSYDHRSMNKKSLFLRKYQLTFVRIYDLLDQNIRVIKSEDLSEFTHLVTDSVRFQFQFPKVISINRNPLQNLASLTEMWQRDRNKFNK